MITQIPQYRLDFRWSDFMKPKTFRRGFEIRSDFLVISGSLNASLATGFTSKWL
jgi:hypothetical protein